jgi:hypothetical protein
LRSQHWQMCSALTALQGLECHKQEQRGTLETNRVQIR